MNNELRERLIKAITNSSVCESEFGDPSLKWIAEDLADSLIASGVILPRFKEGDKIFHIITGDDESPSYINSFVVGTILISKGIRYSPVKQFNTAYSESSLFATQAAAQAALDRLNAKP